jgi:WD40 repeat protein
VVSASSVGEIGLWRFSPDGLQLIQHLVGHKEAVHSADFSPDGRYVVTTSPSDGTARLWDITATGRAEANAIVSHAGVNSDLRLIQDGSQLVTIGYDGMLKVWDMASGGEAIAIQAHDDRIHRLDVSPDGRIIATASDDGTAKLWDTDTWNLLSTLAGHEMASSPFTGVVDVVFSPDGSHLATGGGDGDIIIWKTTTGERLSTLVGHTNFVLDVAFSPDGRLLASAGGDGTVRLWDTATGQNLLTISNDKSNPYFSLDFSPDGSHLLLGRHDGTLEIWELPANLSEVGDETVQLVYTVDSQVGIVLSVHFSFDGSQIVLSGRSGAVQIRDSATGELQLALQLPTLVNCVYFTPDGKQLIACGSDGITRFFTLDLEELITLAHSRATRSLTEAECQQYLHVDVCLEE